MKILVKMALILVATAVIGLPACSGNGTASDDAGVGVGCADGWRECDGVCVETASNPLHCGGCGSVCAEGEVCVDATCTEWDCREAPCPGFSFCDLATGQCQPGCATSDQCAANEVCNLDDHTCTCQSAHHRCSGACVSDVSPATCGDRCEPCPGIANGSASCEAATCDLECDLGYRLCGGVCAPCPLDGVDEWVCAGSECRAANCGPGYRACGDGCVVCPAAPQVQQTACVADRCQATLCEEGYVPCTTGCCVWQLDAVDSGGAGGLAFDLDASGTPHVSYAAAVSSTTQALKYARKAGQSWSTETIATGTNVGGIETSLAVDASGKPYVTFVDYDQSKLRFASKTSAGWAIETVASFPTYGPPSGASSLVLDTAGSPHISFYNNAYTDPGNTSPSGRLQYARRSGSGFTLEVIDGGVENGIIVDVGAANALALGPDNAPHVVYNEGTFDDLRYGKRGSSWSTEDLVTTSSVGQYVDIAVDAAGRPHLAYFHATGDRLHYRHWTGSDWQDMVVATGDVGRWPSLALDAAGRPHIAYHAQGAGTLEYAQWTGTDWAIRTVDVSSGAGHRVRLRLDELGFPHLVYYSGSTDSVVHAH